MYEEATATDMATRLHATHDAIEAVLWAALSDDPLARTQEPLRELAHQSVLNSAALAKAEGK